MYVVTGYHSDDKKVWVEPIGDSGETKHDWGDIVNHWSKSNASVSIPGDEPGYGPREC